MRLDRFVQDKLSMSTFHSLSWTTCTRVGTHQPIRYDWFMMRRIVALTILIVVLSTLLNLAFALGFWWFGERPPPSNPMTFDPQIVVDPRPLDLAVWRDRRGPDWPQEPQAATSQKYLGITFRSMVWYQRDWSDSLEVFDAIVIEVDSYSIYIVELGWPLRCFAGEYWSEWHGPPAPSIDTNGTLVAFGAHWPNRVICSGLIVNELFYGAVIVLSFVGWIQGRRASRRRRGRCPQCAYDLRGEFSAGCPECGWQRASET